jgi:hypothetical protein
MGETMTTIFPAGMVESVMAQFLGQIKNSCDCIIAPPLDDKGKKTLSELDNMKATLVTCMIETESLKTMLEPYSNASLREHHRFCKAILIKFRDYLEANNEKIQQAKATHARPVAEFARRLVEFLSTFHMVLHSKVDLKEKEDLTQSYLGYLPASHGFNVS